MALSQIPDRGTHPQSVANLALAQVTLEALLTPTRKAEERRLPMAAVGESGPRCRWRSRCGSSAWRRRG